MFRIRRIYDQVLPRNKAALKQCEEILRAYFKAVPQAELERLAEKLQNPLKTGFRSILFVAEDGRRKVLGLALLYHDPQRHFSFLDYLVTGNQLRSSGIGGALYERVREVAVELGARGVFFECLPDDPARTPSPEMLKENIARLRFYERYGARPIVNTLYELPIRPAARCTPHLVFDGLDRGEPLAREFAQKAARAILVGKYGHVVTPDYVRDVVGSFHDDPVKLRELRYHKPKALTTEVPPLPREPIALVVSQRHAIHRVSDRGYVESPVRVSNILAALEPTGAFERIEPKHFGDGHITAVHDNGFVSYLRRACELMGTEESLYPYVFPIRNKARPPKELTVRAGYYCIDTFTPLNRNAYLAARDAVDCALTAAGELLEGRRIAYALVRPPGHHAERGAFGGFCYFNNAAIAAHYLSQHGRVAVLDVDYHHGNGTQEIFWERPDVFTVSLHGHPSFAYPYFSGFADECGAGPGEGFNLNLPLPEELDGEGYRKALAKALRAVKDFGPAFLVVALGLDPARLDPTGTWTLRADDFAANGRLIGALGLPTLVVQEGGYRTRTLGANCRAFFDGLLAPSAV
ncbi:MAG TPA: histone deacetylase family protein [Planctomycetota bacterium]|nr:histone deacetylase family protein [Planctomycetota bacterium]